MHYQQKLYFKIPLILFLFSLFSWGTTYENGEDNRTNRWYAYDKNLSYDRNASDKIIKNQWNEERESNVIFFEGEESSLTYLIGTIDGLNSWDNRSEPLLIWSMKMQLFHQLIVFVQTQNGLRQLCFSYDSEGDIFRSNHYIHIPLPSTIKEHDWQTFSFDLRTIIKKVEPTNRLLSVNGLAVQGKGLIDDIQLTSNHDAFIATLEVDDSKKLRISTNNTLDYNFHINWGDGLTDSHINDTVTHTYTKSGQHTIMVTGIYPHIYKLCGRKQSLIAIDQWGTQTWKSMKDSFKECKKFSIINDTKIPDLSHVKSMFRMFYNAQQFNEDISQWNLSHVTDMNSMFYNAYQFNQDIGSWDVSQVEEMQRLFKGSQSFNQDISDWNISSVKRMAKIFEGATSFKQDLSRWNTSSVIDYSPKKKSFQNKKDSISDNGVVTDMQHKLELINGVNETP